MDFNIVDFHTHILPGLDHGCYTLDTARCQLELARNVGVKKILASSHFYPDRHTLDSFIEKRTEAFNSILPFAIEMGIEVIPAAEVLVYTGLDELPGIEKLCIPNTKTMLLELPFTNISDDLFDTVEKFIKKGYKIVLAHAERYRHEYVERMIHIGAFIQLNSSAFTSFFIKRSVKLYIKSGRVVALGSDIHGTSKRYYNSFAKALKRLSGTASQIFALSEKMLSGNCD